MQTLLQKYSEFEKNIGNSPQAFKKIFLFYLFIQFAIWAKVSVYYFFTGAGQTPTIYSYYLFLDPLFFFQSFLSFNNIEQFDLLFHQAMHVLIAYSLFAFARHAQKPAFFALTKIFTIASILHNIGYWLTNVFPNTQLLVFDFITDIIALFFFYYLFKQLNALQFIKKQKMPIFDYI